MRRNFLVIINLKNKPQLIKHQAKREGKKKKKNKKYLQFDKRKYMLLIMKNG